MKPQHTTVARLTLAVLLILSAAWQASADYPSTVLSLGPVGYWRFDETVASPALSIITNASTLGSVANGYCVDAPIKGVPGIIGNCVQLVNPVIASDAGFLGDKIDVPWNAALNPNPPFSIEFWANPTALSTFGADTTGQCVMENFDPNFSGGSRAGWLFYLAPTGKWQFRLGNRAGYAGILTATSGLASPGTWQHIVVTWDGATATMYANGAVIGSAAISVANWVNNPQSFLRFSGTALTGDNPESTAISATSNEGNRGYDGLLEEVAIYPAILSPAKIAAHYSAATTNNAGYTAQILADNPAGFWPMHDAAVTAPTAPFPVANNIGSLGSAANGTNFWGALADQPGPGYAGFGAGDKAVFFDGDTGYCQINNSPGLHFTNTITLAAWIKPTEQDYFRDIIAHGFDPVTDAETFLRISRGAGGDGTGDGNYYEVGSTDGATFYDDVLFPIPPGDIGQWVFLVGTFDGVNWNLYRDGVLVGSALAFGPGVVDVTNQWTIGSRGVDAHFVGQGLFFGGSIDEPAIFTNALAPSDVANLYAAAEVPPIITQAPQNPGATLGYAPQGSTVSFSVLADGSPTLGYMWTSNSIPTGVTTPNYSISNIGLGTYTIAVIVTNAYGTNTPSVSFVVSNEPPFIATQPVPEQRFSGFPFTLSAVVGGSPPLTYYWRLGNTVVASGSTNSILTAITYTAAASPATAGNYTVIISNATSINVTSAPVAVASFPITTPYPADVVISNQPPISYYRLDEPSGTTAYDRIGGRNGTYFGATLGVPGYVSSTVDPDLAASFSGLNSYIGNIDGSPATGIYFSGHTNFTLEAWVNAPEGQADQATIIAKGIGNNGTIETEQFGLDVSSGTYRFFATRPASATTIYISQAFATEGPNGTWQHVVGVYDDLNTTGQGTNMYIYVNGVLEGTFVTIPPGLNNNSGPVSIGSKRTGNDPNFDGTFNGSIDEVSIYNYALTANQVYSNFTSAYGTTLAPFITLQPAGVTNYAGLPVTFSVEAAGSFPLNYQWKKNGGAIGGATDSALILSPVGSGDAGSYSVTIQNNIGSTNSISVPLVVLSPPTNVPVIDGLVLHMTFDNNLNDLTGRGNGTGQYVYNPGAVSTNYSYASNSFFAVTNTLAPGDTNAGVGGAPFAYMPDGELGQALHFSTEAMILNSGSIGTNDYFVTLGVRPDLQFGANSFTVAFWIRTQRGYQAGDLPFFTDALTSTFGTGFVFAPVYGFGTATPTQVQNSLNFQLAGGWACSIEGSGGGVGLYGDGNTINDGGWHHLVYIIDRNRGLITTVLDGAPAHAVRAGGTKLGDAGNINVANAVTIGQDPSGQYGESGAFDIDDLGVWNRALSQLEAATIFISAISNQTSFTGPVLLLLKNIPGNKVQLSWPSGVLQSAPNVTGPYTSLTNTSPYTNPITGSKQFFRVKQ